MKARTMRFAVISVFYLALGSQATALAQNPDAKKNDLKIPVRIDDEGQTTFFAKATLKDDASGGGFRVTYFGGLYSDCGCISQGYDIELDSKCTLLRFNTDNDHRRLNRRVLTEAQFRNIYSAKPDVKKAKARSTASVSKSGRAPQSSDGHDAKHEFLSEKELERLVTYANDRPQLARIYRLLDDSDASNSQQVAEWDYAARASRAFQEWENQSGSQPLNFRQAGNSVATFLVHLGKIRAALCKELTGDGDGQWPVYKGLPLQNEYRMP